MNRIIFAFGALLIPVFAAHMVLAAGLFKVGEKAPSFALTAITGEMVALDTYTGKVVVLGLFHICEPCMIQGTAFQKVSEMTKGKDVVVLGVNSSGDSRKSVGEFLSAFPVKVTLSSNSKCNTTSPAGLRCCHVNKILSTHDCRRT